VTKIHENRDQLEIAALTSERWEDFEELFGKRGAYGGCWCMWWRLTRKEFEAGQGAKNRQAMKSIVDSGEIPGIIAYRENKPIGWCSVAPRRQFGTLERSRVLRRLDEKPVWSIVCFFIHKQYRKQGIALYLIRAAVNYVQERNGKIVEAYPTVPWERRLPPVSSYMGVPSLYTKAGFVEKASPSKSRLIMRYYIK
jgi:GNAT superfamily N-acetyltransferase